MPMSNDATTPRRTYTTAEAATAAGYSRDGFHAMMTKLRAGGGPDFRLPGHDNRSPLWDADAVDDWAAHLVRRPRRHPPSPSTSPRDAGGDPQPDAWQKPCPLPGCTGHHDPHHALQHAASLTRTARETTQAARHLQLSVARQLLTDGHTLDDTRAATGLPVTTLRRLAEPSRALADRQRQDHRPVEAPTQGAIPTVAPGEAPPQVRHSSVDHSN